jgi:hypothetical protein
MPAQYYDCIPHRDLDKTLPRRHLRMKIGKLL